MQNKLIIFKENKKKVPVKKAPFLGNYFVICY